MPITYLTGQRKNAKIGLPLDIVIHLITYLVVLLSCQDPRQTNAKGDPPSTPDIESDMDGYLVREKKLLDYMPVLFWQRDSATEANHEHYYNEDGSDIKPYVEKYEKFVLDTIIHYEKDLYNPVKIMIEKGYLFDHDYIHLIVGHENRRDIYCRNTFGSDLYHEAIPDEKYHRVIHADIEIDFVGDTIFDANGDGYKDYAIILYSQSGCCQREVYRVYLYLPHCGGFTPYFEFMNPTFYPKEKLIRGVHYGHPGEVGLYKIKWDGVITRSIIEIYPNWQDSVNYTYLQYRVRDSIGQKPDKILYKLPHDFENITSIEWFKGYEPKDFGERIRAIKSEKE